MNIYIWKRVDNCSLNYHPEGGVVVIAETLEDAMQLANKREGCVIEPHEIPDLVLEVITETPGAFYFDDAGCC